MILPDEFQLKSPFYDRFEDKDDPKALLFVEQVNYLYEKFVAGTLFIKFIDGDRKGAIANVKPNIKTFGDKILTWRCSIEYALSYGYDRSNKHYKFEYNRFYGIATWADIKRKNQVQISLPDRDTVFLPNYTGPTVWALFDHKAAKAEVLKEPDQTDIDGNVLAIGDPVLYINARYGSGMCLEHGTIKEFKASVDSRKTEIWTIVTNSEGTESKISNSSNMIYKKFRTKELKTHFN